MDALEESHGSGGGVAGAWVANTKACQGVPMEVSKNRFTHFDNTRYFQSLDGLRAIFVTLVMFNHVHVSVPLWIHSPLGVDGFFVLSGFLITTLLLREDRKYGRISLKAFYTRRFFRIIPVYMFTILLYCVTAFSMHDSLKIAHFKASLPWLLSFMEEYRPVSMAGNIMGHAWSLGVEEKFYVLWPLLVVWMIPFRGRNAWWLAGTAVVVSLFPFPYYINYGGLLIGAVLAIALFKHADWKILTRIPPLPDSLILLILLLCYLPFNWRSNGYELLFSAGVAILVASLVLRKGITRKLLENPALVFVGKRSYSFYLIHVLAIDLAEKILRHFVTLNVANVVGGAFVLSLAGASLMHRFIELPCIALGRQLTKKLAHHEPVSKAAT